jgi:hypothetical protein
MGTCVTAPPVMVDSGTVIREDSGLPPDDAYVVDFLSDAGMDASTARPGGRRTGCTCEVPSRTNGPSGLTWLALAALSALLLRKRS